MDNTELTPVEADVSEKPKRPVLLSILLILSFIGSGLALILSIIVAIGGSWADFFNQLPLTDTVIREDSIGNLYYCLLKVVLNGFSLLGLSLMWKMARKGFWFYLTAQLLLLGVPFIFLQRMGMDYLLTRLMINGIFTFFFVILYLLFLKRLK